MTPLPLHPSPQVHTPENNEGLQLAQREFSLGFGLGLTSVSLLFPGPVLPLDSVLSSLKQSGCMASWGLKLYLSVDIATCSVVTNSTS